MKKIVRQQNYLRELIESQGNRFLTRSALKCWIRSAVEPLLDAPEAGVVLHRIENKDGLQGLLKRLEYSEVETLSYTDNSKNLIEKLIGFIRFGSEIKGVAVRSSGDRIFIDMSVIVKYGVSIKAVIEALKESIKYKVERFTGMIVDTINVNVTGVMN